MILVSTQWISRVLSATMIGRAVQVDTVSTDTRFIVPGALFIALRGPNFDAHQFAAQAVAKGAAALVVDHRVDVDIPQIVVADTTKALGELGAAIKAQLRPQTIAITGSVGKTSVKEMVASILSRLGDVLATEGNFNNEIGVPLTLLRLEQHHKFAVIELGANHPGEIAYTTGLVKPDVCMINNVAEAHLEGFVDLHGVARAKGEIFAYAPEDAIAVVNCDSPFKDQWLRRLKDRPTKCFGLSVNRTDVAVDVWVDKISLDSFGCASFILYHNDQTRVEQVAVTLNVPGIHNVNNALAAASVCLCVGASLADISIGLNSMKPIHGRVNLIKLNSALTVIDDTYNANVESAKAAIDLLCAMAGLKILVLGDMAELGLNARTYHEEVGIYAKLKGIDKLYTLGVLSQNASELYGENGKHFSSRALLIDHICHAVDHAKQQASLLVKGSRSAKMELVVEAVVSHYDQTQQNTLEAC